MDHNSQDHKSSDPVQMNSQNGGTAAADQPALRSRWTPKPEQILILESIFNKGMVNPPKDETPRIRKLLEKFGPVCDANIFYWFQNRRSRSRRQQRQQLQQLQRDLFGADPREEAAAAAAAAASSGGAATFQVGGSNTTVAAINNFVANSFSSRKRSRSFKPHGLLCNNPSSIDNSSSSSSSFVADVFQMGYTEENDHMPFPNLSFQFQHQPETITVFINGVASEFPLGFIDLKSMFGPNTFLVHSSGYIPPVNEYGVLIQNLKMGESYFLVSNQ